PLLFVLGTNEGRYEQFLINTLGPIELWALSTSMEDVSIRNRLYNTVGAAWGRKILAAAFPGGSARTEIKRRVLMRGEQEGESKAALTSEVIEEIATELIRKVEERQAAENDQEIKDSL
ncbi:MAG: hypothetical protein KDJ15_02860, partial [Alphaproteobacteria bacterium]|nr:hypothetical protein [Alphaproteobacteria bacterium]